MNEPLKIYLVIQIASNGAFLLVWLIAKILR